MALRHAILAALLDHDATGYDLAKRFDVSVANYWTATRQQLYRELDGMAGDGLVAAEVVRQEGRPDKRVYSLTADGRRALADFVAGAPRPSAIRDELLVQVEAVDVTDPATLLGTLAERRDESRAKLEIYLRRRERLLDGRTEDELVAGGGRIGPYLTLERGIAYERENVAWSDRTIAALEARVASATSEPLDR